mgnify:CR=1 FL=1
MVFQSFLFWMLIRKQLAFSGWTGAGSCFNPSYSGCWFGRVIKSALNSCFMARFNPSYSGCWFGSLQPIISISRNRLFQSFLFWMLIRKFRVLGFTFQQRKEFQSFLFWMLIRKPESRNIYRQSIKVSILLILDVDSEVLVYRRTRRCQALVSILLILDVDSEGLSTWRQSVGYQVSILLILDVDSEVCELVAAIFLKHGFNPSYSGCWFGSLKTPTNRRLIPCFNPSYSGCWFGSTAIYHSSLTVSRVSILLILDVDSEVNLVLLKCF